MDDLQGLKGMVAVVAYFGNCLVWNSVDLPDVIPEDVCDFRSLS
jgi:hypothetical protein